MKIFFISSFLCISFFLCSGQNSDIKRTWHWYFGNHAGIDFSSGLGVADTTGKIVDFEGCSSMSDTSGNLQFYTNGITVWNALHDTMQNGTGLWGGMSSTQSALIVPKPNDLNLYFIFTTDEGAGVSGGFGGLSYSIVDMSLDAGLGGILQKNISLITPTTEKLNATRHNNKQDYWIVVHGWNTNNFYSYLLTEGGLDTIPVISSAGIIHAAGTANIESQGSMIFSPNGKKITVEIQESSVASQIFDFDNEFGIVSNSINLPNDTDFYGASFSPDNTKLYISDFYHIFQYDLASGNPSLNNKTLIAANPGYGAMQLGSDGRVYIAKTNDTVIAIISNPNQTGTACNFIDNTFSLNGMYCAVGLPNIINSYLSIPDAVQEDYSNPKFTMFPNPVNDILNITASAEKECSSKIHFCFFDIIGQNAGSVEENKTQINGQSLTKSFDFSKTPQGIYFLKIQMGEKIIISKIIHIN